MDVVIIGAGLSGLTAAVTLQEAGISVQVLEADAQIGGRIRSVRDGASTQAVADLGPTWVWPKYQPVVARWLSKLDIKTFDQFNSVEQFISEPAVETLTVSVLPRAAWFDISRLRSNSCNPFSYGLSDELRAVVRPYECWRATHYK